MKTTVEAIFEDGVFKPVERPEIPEGEHVQLTVETTERAVGEDPLELAARVYEGLRPEEMDEIERIALDRGRFAAASSSWPVVDPSLTPLVSDCARFGS